MSASSKALDGEEVFLFVVVVGVVLLAAVLAIVRHNLDSLADAVVSYRERNRVSGWGLTCFLVIVLAVVAGLAVVFLVHMVGTTNWIPTTLLPTPTP